MGMPNIDDIKPDINLTREQVINLLLSSIALEELGIAHIINAEGEKIQSIVKLVDSGIIEQSALKDLVAIDKSVQTTMRDLIKKEMLLEFKFENILDLMDKNTES